MSAADLDVINEPGSDPPREGALYQGALPGERGPSTLSQSRSMQTRTSNVLAVALVMIVALGLLSWYYSRALARPARVAPSLAANPALRSGAEVPLPPLKIDAPEPTVPTPNPTGAVDRPPPAWMASAPLEESSVSPNVPAVGAGVVDRRLTGSVFLGGSAGQSINVPAPAATTASLAGASGTGEAVGALTNPALSGASAVVRIPNQRLLLAKGTFIDCTLETAIDSTLAGMTTCITATDTFSVDGKVVLMERGTKLIGETRGQVQQGAARIFVMWNEARTPAGVVVPLASPGADELGRAGLPGRVNRHFWERFGAAIMISTINGAVQSAVQASSHGGGAVVYNPAGSQDVLTEVLKSTVSIAPTVVKQQGDRIQILVARDLDFRTVYELRSVGASR